MKYLRLLLCFLGLATAAQAQLSVSISIKQRFHLLYEPVIATVNVTNQTGREITLSDSPQYQWFGFRVMGEGDRMIPLRNTNYHLAPITMQPGETVKRSVNLNQLFEMGESGQYRIQANVCFIDKFYSSRPTFIDVSEGHVVGRKTAGVPEGQPGAGQIRTFTLLSHQVGESNTLYVRVEDQADSMVYCTFPIGRLLDNVPPQAEFDSSNNLYILHLVGMRAYVLTKVSPSGEFLGQTNYSAPKTRPELRKIADGALQIIGGRREGSVAKVDLPVEPPKLSARPAGFPKN